MALKLDEKNFCFKTKVIIETKS